MPTERREIDYDKYRHVLSASQFETFAMCERKWAFQSLFKMPRQESESNVFGNTLHAVAERWLKADDLGRGADGKPVDLYPVDWAKDLTPANADAIKALVEKAITAGVLERRPNRAIEEPFLDEVVPGVMMQGYIDMMLPGEIQDHKTAKNTRYIKTPATLRTNPQMLIYAHHAIMAGSATIAEQRGVKLRHNVFVRQPLKVIRTESEVRTDEVMDFWNNEVVPAAERMAQLKEKGLTENDWRKFSGPADENSACNAYGGCPYLSICNGHRAPSDLRDLLLSVSSGSINEPSQGTSMGIMDKLLGGSAPAVSAPPAVKAPVPSVTAAPATTVAAAPNSPLATAGTQPPSNLPVGAAPWAQATCNSCKATGFNLKTGGACFVCDSMSRSKNGPTAAQFVINVVNGIAMWRSQDGTKHGDVLLEAGTAPVKVQVREALPPADAASLAAVTTTESGTPVTAEPPKRGRGRPKKVALPEVVNQNGAVETAPPVPTTLAGQMAKDILDEVASANLGTVPPTRDEADLLDGQPAAAHEKFEAPKPVNEKRGGLGGLTLIIGAVQIGGVGVANGVSRDLSTLIRERIGPELAKKQGVASFFAIPACTRRDALVQAAAQIANSLGTMTVTVQHNDLDALALAQAMVPHASVAFQGVN